MRPPYNPAGIFDPQQLWLEGKQKGVKRRLPLQETLALPMQEASRTGFRKISGPGFTTMLKLSTGHCDPLTGWQGVAVLPFLASLVISFEGLFCIFFFKDRLLLYISGYLASCQVAQDGLEL